MTEMIADVEIKYMFRPFAVLSFMYSAVATTVWGLQLSPTKITVWALLGFSFSMATTIGHFSCFMVVFNDLCARCRTNTPQESPNDRRLHLIMFIGIPMASQLLALMIAVMQFAVIAYEAAGTSGYAVWTIILAATFSSAAILGGMMFNAYRSETATPAEPEKNTT